MRQQLLLAAVAAALQALSAAGRRPVAGCASMPVLHTAQLVSLLLWRTGLVPKGHVAAWLRRCWAPSARACSHK